MKIAVYDWDNKETVVEIGNKKIERVLVRVLSGDEVVEVFFENGSSVIVDSNNQRTLDFFDGEYELVGHNIDKWNRHSKEQEKTTSYSRLELFG